MLGVITTDVDALVLRLAITSALRGLSRDDSQDRFTVEARIIEKFLSDSSIQAEEI